MMNDTIAAISSGLTESGIGIIRLSGSDSYKITDRIFRTKSGKRVDLSEPNKVHYGFIVSYVEEESAVLTQKNKSNVSHETLDEVLVINMRAPHTYTGEDTIEIDCHGGVLMMKRILEAVIEAGARPADPGEFTKRAFLNGRIDLSQAEAVIDIITAKNDDAIKASVSQLKGNISRCITKLRAEILHNTALIEAALDDPEHYSLEGFSEKLKTDIKNISARLDELIKSYGRGRIVKEGINTVIIGKPNAGKSSLLNAILGEERAIVTQIPGTTRDTINESVSIGNITLNIADTAGIRRTEDIVEKIGVERALKCAESADLILLVTDISEASVETDEDMLKHIKKLITRADTGMPTEKNSTPPKLLTIFNKSDLPAAVDIKRFLSGLPENSRDYIIISAKTEKGIEELYEYIDKMFTAGKINYNDQLVISSARHLSLLKKAEKSMESVMNSIEMSMPEDMYTIDLMDAYESLGEIIGEEVGEDLVNEIFSKFCMGK